MKLLDTYTDPAEIRSDFSYYAAPWTLVPREWENEKPNFRPQLTVPLQHRQLQYQVRAVCLSKQTNRQTKQNKWASTIPNGGEHSSSESAIKFRIRKVPEICIEKEKNMVISPSKCDLG